VVVVVVIREVALIGRGGLFAIEGWIWAVVMKVMMVMMVMIEGAQVIERVDARDVSFWRVADTAVSSCREEE
jgi:hypothetical protein